jgi:PDZ domain-containing secreted protein
MVENSDAIIGIGGGEVARDELLAARRSGKKVHFIPADMNHQKARESARKKKLPEPTDFHGAANAAF